MSYHGPRGGSYGGRGGHGGGRAGGRDGGGRGHRHDRDRNEGSRGGYDRGDRGGRGDDRGQYGGGRGSDRGDGGRGGRGGGGRGGGQGPTSIQSALSNIILATVDPNFKFYLYGIECTDRRGNMIDSIGRRRQLFEMGMWNGLYRDMPEQVKQGHKRTVFFKGSFFYSRDALAGLEQQTLPVTLCNGTTTEGDEMRVVNVQCFTLPDEMRANVAHTRDEMEIVMDRRCGTPGCTKSFADLGGLLAHCGAAGHVPVFEANDNNQPPRAASPNELVSYTNVALSQAMSERMARWGRDFVDPKSFTEPTDRRGQSMGIRIYQSYVATFGLMKPKPTSPAYLTLTVDVKAKIMRSLSLLHLITSGDPRRGLKLNRRHEEELQRQWRGESVIAMYDKKVYHVTNLVFGKSPNSLMIEGLGVSHAEYFARRKKIQLEFADVPLMVEVEGRRNTKIFFPPELVCGTELSIEVKRELPKIASYTPQVRSNAIDVIKRYLTPGAQRTKGLEGLLPALGIYLNEVRLAVKCMTKSLPEIITAGITIPPSRGTNWAPMLGRANFNVNPKQATFLNVVVIVHQSVEMSAINMYRRIRAMVNNLGASFRFAEAPYAVVPAGDMEKHWGVVERYFGGTSNLPANIFVIDINRQAADPAYPVVKKMLGDAGYLSQFINLKTCNHAEPRDLKKSDMILESVSRQVLSKCGFRIWWVKIPRSIPLPAVFIGVDVFHAPRKFDPVTRKRIAKESCAAIIVQLRRDNSESNRKIEVYSQTFKRGAAEEYNLGAAMEETVSNALRHFDVSPQSCFVWRDGVGDTAVAPTAAEEVPSVRRALAKVSPGRAPALSYIVCQKRISTKFVTHPTVPGDTSFSAPPGTTVMGVQGMSHSTFYINGTCPPFATAKPVRYIVAEQGEGMTTETLADLSWALSHDYANWAGPVKVPSVCQLAHKAAELSGGLADCGESLRHDKFAGTLYFL